MKKNAMLKIAAILLVAVLLTTCAISTTFAKYVTNGGGASQTARVAKWGFVVNTIADDDIFAVKYGTSASDIYVQGTVTTGESADTVLAPGTKVDKKSVLKIDNGADNAVKPEVDYRVSAIVDVSLENWMVDGNVYFPLTVFVGTQTLTFADKTIVEIEEAIENAIIKELTGLATVDRTDYVDLGATSTEYKPGEDAIAKVIDSTDTTGYKCNLQLGWEWANNETYNDEDTALGNAAAAGTAVPRITIAYSVSIEQVLGTSASTPKA